jgi:Flp pilus assembly pilin Flp
MKVVEIAKRFVKDERGLETVEYAIIAGLIVVGTIATIATIGLWVKAKFDTLNTTLGTP